jgi:hypothetical protein
LKDEQELEAIASDINADESEESSGDDNGDETHKVVTKPGSSTLVGRDSKGLFKNHANFVKLRNQIN